MAKPNVVLVKFRINDRRADDLKKVGVHFHERTVQRDIELRQNQMAESASHGVDHFRLGRTDATGTVRGDSGTPMFDRNGLPNAVLVETVNDLQANLGLILTGINLLKKPGDKVMTYFVMKFEPTGTKLELTDSQRPLVNEIVGRTYEFLHGYKNPSGSWTFNTAHVKDAKVVNDVHVDVDGEVSHTSRAQT